jgi:AbrB family looped-hinge helix DNA binding protein
MAPGTCLVVIPKDVRERLGIRSGQRIRAIHVGTRVEIVPVEPMRNLRGACPACRLELRRAAWGVP